MINEWCFKYLVYYPVVLFRRQWVWAYLKELKQSQYWNEKQLTTHQLNKLKELLDYVLKYVPHYKEQFQHIDTQDIINLSDITKLPCLTKTQIKQCPVSIASSESLKQLTAKTTGGSTGQPITILKTADAMARELAATWRAYEWAGVDIGQRQGRFWGVPKKKKDRFRAQIIDFVTNRKRCSAFAFDERDLEVYTKQLVNFKPSYFYGYVSMLGEYAEYFARRGQKPPFDLRCIITTAEILPDYYRRLLEQVFDTRVFNEYGCGELGSVAHECENGSMHIMAENMIVEVLDGDQPCRPGDLGELVITELNNHAMPLIRYRTGDYASISPSSCSCGRQLPVIENLVGRAYDMLRNKEGRLFHGEFFMYIFEDAKRQNMGISAFQVRQLEVDHFLINIKPERGYTEETKMFITERIREDFDPNALVDFQEVEFIERQASGKMRLICGMQHSQEG